MIWFKSFMVGLLSVLLAMPVIFIVLGVILKAKSGLPSIAIDVVSYSHNIAVRLILVTVFVIAFFWEYLRLRGG